MKSNEIRQKFLEYFKACDHTIVAGSSLVPADDPTLLFTNAGMVQFKNVFLGLEKRNYVRAVSSQPCIRAGGKHNDLENVGYTARHHTFFEMLGNFSFGDYFKEQAIAYAWDFLTNHLKIPVNKLWITVYEEDDEAFDLWLKIGVEKNRILRCGAKDNFWSMGETGPCGPCTEIYYDHGESIRGGLPGTPEEDGDRYIEIWNLVFMQYERHADGSLTKLPKPSVDTGMGLERISAVMQNVHNNYDIDLFKNLIHVAEKMAKHKHVHSLQVLADHIRSTSFLIMDGVIPSNEGRGYVLRRIIRRAIRHGYQCGMVSPFFYQLVDPLVKEMGEAYPPLKKSQAFIEKTVMQEEGQFVQTLENGMKILNQAIENLSGKMIPGEIVFKLYDTYGFPIDLTADIAREKNLSIDQKGFEVEMEKQRKQSQQHQKFSSESLNQAAHQLKDHVSTNFTGYENLEEANAMVTAIVEGGLVLDKTPFYAESGGQVGDQGIISQANNVFVVKDTKKVGQHIVHYGEFKSGKFSANDKVIAAVDKVKRQAAALNHTATHLLHAALKKILGEHVQQKGSLVAPDKLRFDFSHPAPLIPEEIEKIEKLVNQEIRYDYMAVKREMTPDEAIKSGAVALFGEKYGDRVRTLKLGEFSYEVCGGTHVNRTGEIGLFKITTETGVAAGVRRLEAVTGEGAEIYIKAERENLLQQLQQEREKNKLLQKQMEQLNAKLARGQSHQLLDQVKEIHGVKVLSASLEGIDGKALREMVDQLKQKLQSGIVVLGSTQGENVNLIVGVTKDLIEKYPANQLIKPLAEMVGGKGGGRPDMAQAGGDKPEALEKALSEVYKLI